MLSRSRALRQSFSFVTDGVLATLGPSRGRGHSGRSRASAGASSGRGALSRRASFGSSQGGGRSSSSRAGDVVEPLYAGTFSTQYCDTPDFRRSVGEFPVFQQLGVDGTLSAGADLPFSLDAAVRMYRTMLRSIEYDNVLLKMQRQGRISFYCANYGEEATSVGTAAALEPQDLIWPQYRELGMFLWRGLTAEQICDQNIGNEDDGSKGRNLQVHYCLPDANVQSVHAVLSTHIAQAPGAGYAFKISQEDRISVAYFGDGAASEGDAMAGMNSAAVYGAQTLFICRNNGYSISTHVSDQYAGDGIAARGLAYGMPSIRVDGNDIVAVYRATKEARRICIDEKTPVLLELMTYRVGDHTTSDDSSAYRRETSAEKERWAREGPVPRLRALLEARGVWTEALESSWREEANQEIMGAMRKGEAKKKPSVKELFADVYAEPPWHLREQHAYLEQHLRDYASEYSIDKFRDLDGPAPTLEASPPSCVARVPNQPIGGQTARMTMYQSINDAMAIAMQSDDKTVLFGEDVGFGGVFRCSEGLREKFGEERVMNAPVAEGAIAGFGIGLAVAGYTAIAEIQFADYIFPAFDQIVSELAKYRYRAGGLCNAGGVTIRAPCSAVGHGSMYHSQSVEAYFAHCPGLVIVVPRGPIQAKGLLLASIRDPNPVLFFEPKVLYRRDVEEVPLADYTLNLGQAEIVREGSDVTLVGWGPQVFRLLEAAERASALDGVTCEVIDLQTIVPWDVDAVARSVEKTSRLIVAHEAPSTCGFGAEIAAKIQERCFLHLASPIQRVCGFDTPFPYCHEEIYLPTPARCYESIKKVMAF